jgi:hypothetical protein
MASAQATIRRTRGQGLAFSMFVRRLRAWESLTLLGCCQAASRAASGTGLKKKAVSVTPFQVQMRRQLSVRFAKSHHRSESGSSFGISASGSVSVAANDLPLTAAPAIPGEFGVFFHGGAQATIPFGDGLLCATSRIVRVWLSVQTDVNGTANVLLNNTVPAGVHIAVSATRSSRVRRAATPSPGYRRTRSSGCRSARRSR